jgi:hypothetical protein
VSFTIIKTSKNYANLKNLGIIKGIKGELSISGIAYKISLINPLGTIKQSHRYYYLKLNVFKLTYLPKKSETE